MFYPPSISTDIRGPTHDLSEFGHRPRFRRHLGDEVVSLWCLSIQRHLGGTGEDTNLPVHGHQCGYGFQRFSSNLLLDVRAFVPGLYHQA